MCWRRRFRPYAFEYKLSLLCFNHFPSGPYLYLSERLHLYTPSRQLRSSADNRMFRMPSFRIKSSGQSSLSHQAPTIWNQLPVSVRHSNSVLFLNLPWKLLSFQIPFLQSQFLDIRLSLSPSLPLSLPPSLSLSL